VPGPTAQPLATPGDNGDGHVSAEREAAFKAPGKVRGVRRFAGAFGALPGRSALCRGVRRFERSPARLSNGIFAASISMLCAFCVLLYQCDLNPARHRGADLTETVQIGQFVSQTLWRAILS